MGIDSTKDDFHLTFFHLNGDGEIVARFVPQPSSQFSKFGVMLREGLQPGAAHVSLMIYPGATGQIEAPMWHARLLSRNVAGDKTITNNIGDTLTDAAVTWGRLTGYVWLRLQRHKNKITGSISYDGKAWTKTGTTTISLKKNVFAGLPVCSGMPNSTTIMFDNVSVK
jgi:hypothetical protein